MSTAPGAGSPVPVPDGRTIAAAAPAWRDTPVPRGLGVIDELQIRALGVIEEADLALAPGLTVVTGETGAGKTLLVTALQLLLGARADTSLVRHGEDDARVAARLVPAPPEATAWTDDDELVVERELRDGRSRARIAGRLAPISALEEVLGGHVEVHAQGEHARLLRPDEQRRLLDRFAGPEHAEALAAHAELYAELREVQHRLQRLEDDARERQRTMDRLRHELAEIEAVAPDPASDGDLAARLAVLEHAEELALAAGRAAAALGTEGVGQPLGEAVEALRRLPAPDPALDEAHERVVALTEEVRDLATTLRRHGEELAADPERLEELRARQRALQELYRRYGADPVQVLEHAEAAAKQLLVLEDEEADAGGLEQRAAQLEEEVRASAAGLRAARRAAADRLTAGVDARLADLGMPHAGFHVVLDDAPAARHGADRVRFELAANPGEPPASLEKAASGGERSRVMLAIEVTLADAEGASVLVFDEVDAGIGGATALAVGETLARLARVGSGRQVLCVTHLAQLAAFADVHHTVVKEVVDGRTVTRVERVADEDRVAELARMLGGDAGGAAGREHARTLLEEAARRAA